LDLGQIVDVPSRSIAFTITPMVFDTCRERLLQRRQIMAAGGKRIVGDLSKPLGPLL